MSKSILDNPVAWIVVIGVGLFLLNRAKPGLIASAIGPLGINNLTPKTNTGSSGPAPVFGPQGQGTGTASPVTAAISATGGKAAPPTTVVAITPVATPGGVVSTSNNEPPPIAYAGSLIPNINAAGNLDFGGGPAPQWAPTPNFGWSS